MKNEDAEEARIVNEIEARYGERVPTSGLAHRVEHGVLLASVLRAIVDLYLSSMALVSRSAVELWRRESETAPQEEPGGRESS